jgi:hypothetical protein
VSLSDDVLRLAANGGELPAAAISFYESDPLAAAQRVLQDCVAGDHGSQSNLEDSCWELLASVSRTRVWAARIGTGGPSWLARAREVLNEPQRSVLRASLVRSGYTPSTSRGASGDISAARLPHTALDVGCAMELPANMEEQAEALRRATERAETAEAKLAEIEAQKGSLNCSAEVSKHNEQAITGNTEIDTANAQDEEFFQDEEAGPRRNGGIEELRKDAMMAHLLDSLEAGNDIGHYGRLVFTMVARHFLPAQEVLRQLRQDKDFSEEQAALMLRQVEARDYNPPKRERILEWQSQQEFPILPNTEDPDCGNVYRNLKFPPKIYEHIEQYQEEKLEARA